MKTIYYDCHQEYTSPVQYTRCGILITADPHLTTKTLGKDHVGKETKNISIKYL